MVVWLSEAVLIVPLEGAAKGARGVETQRVGALASAESPTTPMRREM